MHAITLVTLPFASVFMGALLARTIGWRLPQIEKLLLGFSGSFLLSITLIEMIPAIITRSSDSKMMSLWILGGILLQIILESFSKGAEHGHIHLEDNSSMKRLFPLLIALFIHAFLEGFPLAHHEHLLWAIVLHKIPIGIIIYSLLTSSKLNPIQTLGILVFFSSMTPLGSLFGESPSFLGILPYLNAVSAGIFLHVSTIILFETEKGHRFNVGKVAVVILGFALGYLI